MRRGRVGQDPRVRAARQRYAAEGVVDGKQIASNAQRHRAPTGAAGEHKRAVDVEENDRSRRAPCSAFAADVACARPLGRRFFLEADALAFIELVEAALHRAAVEEPLLAAIVANEPEPSVPNESLDRAGSPSRVVSLGAVVPRIRLSISVPLASLTKFVDLSLSTRMSLGETREADTVMCKMKG